MRSRLKVWAATGDFSCVDTSANDAFNCVDTGGFFRARYRVASAADAGVTEAASNAVSSIVNHYDHQSPPLRWQEAQNAFKVLGE